MGYQKLHLHRMADARGCRNGKKEKRKLGVSNTPYDGGWWVTDGGWCVTDGGWWVATKHQRVDAIVKKKKGERPYGTPWPMHNFKPIWARLGSSPPFLESPRLKSAMR